MWILIKMKVEKNCRTALVLIKCDTAAESSVQQQQQQQQRRRQKVNRKMAANVAVVHVIYYHRRLVIKTEQAAQVKPEKCTHTDTSVAGCASGKYEQLTAAVSHHFCLRSLAQLSSSHYRPAHSIRTK